MRQLGERYRLDSVVGRGGMAAVWRARDLVLNRTVAVKVLTADHADDPALVEAVQDEARSAARLSHPHIAAVHDYGEVREGDAVLPFVVMEFVDGQTLATRIAERGPLDWREAVTVCAEVAEALAAAHAAGVVHRDIKPGNVMLTADGVKVVDFGIAAPAGREPTDAAGRMWGTPAYLPPEQLRDGAALPAGDVYALGLLLHECLAGRSPWAATGRRKVLARRRRRPVPALPMCPDRPPALAALYRRCLADEPDDRPTARAVAHALGRVAATGTGTRPAAPGHPGADPAAATRPLRRRGRYRRLATLASAPAAVAAGVLVAQLPGTSSPAEPAQAEAAGAAPGCAAEYSSNRRTDGSFAARLRMVNTGGHGLADWSVRFAVPDGYQVTDADLDWTQRRRTVTVGADEPLAPGATVTVSLRGTFADSAGPPGEFSVNGVACERAITRIATSATAAAPTERARRPADGAGGGGSKLSSRSPKAAEVTTPPTTAVTSPAGPAPGPSGTPGPGPSRSRSLAPSTSSPSPTTARPSASRQPSASAEPGPQPTESTAPAPTGEPEPTNPASSASATTEPSSSASASSASSATAA